jgi:hypothetical protein
MQLSMQYTWISLNLTRVCNQARRWVEEVFSSSKCASISPMCKREPSRAGHLLFILFHSRASHYQLHWTIFGGDRRCTVASIAKPTDTTGASVAPTAATCPARSNSMVKFLSVRRVRCVSVRRARRSRPSVCRLWQTRSRERVNASSR